MFLYPRFTVESVLELGDLIDFAAEEGNRTLLDLLRSPDQIQSRNSDELIEHGYEACIELEQAPGLQPVCVLLQAMEQHALSRFDPADGASIPVMGTARAWQILRIASQYGGFVRQDLQAVAGCGNIRGTV